jgi:hypothetical protein
VQCQYSLAYRQECIEVSCVESATDLQTGDGVFADDELAVVVAIEVCSGFGEGFAAWKDLLMGLGEVALEGGADEGVSFGCCVADLDEGLAMDCRLTLVSCRS